MILIPTVYPKKMKGEHKMNTKQKLSKKRNRKEGYVN